MQNSNSNWPQFRGPDGAGVGPDPRLPARWSPTQNIAWRTPIPGRSWSSPIVWGNRIFVTAVVRPDDEEAPRKGLYFGGERPEIPTSEHRFEVRCLDVATGKPLWERVVHRGAPKTARHLKSSYGPETPVTDGQRVYVLFGGLGVWALDVRTGKELWSAPREPRKTRNGWGGAASPALHDGRLFLVDDNDERSEVTALDAKTGRPLWRQARDEGSNWATPFLWRSGARAELVVSGTRAVRSYDPVGGRLLWSLRGMSSIAIPTPVAGAGLLFVSSGYVGDSMRPLYAIRPGGSGDLTGSPAVAWSNSTAGPYNPSPLFYDGRVYVLYDRGLLSCFDAKTGRTLYDRERLPPGSGFTASPWAAGGRVYCLNEDGVCFTVRAGETFELLHTSRLGDDEMCLATPAIAGDRLLIRTASALTCVRSRQEGVRG